MASLPENLVSMDHWTFRPIIPDSWFTEAIAQHDDEILTKTLQKSLPDTVSPFSFRSLMEPETTPTSTVSGLSCSEQEPAPKRQRSAVQSGTGKKRKSRASKRSQTTFITADPANFRRMVQQVTGVRFGSSQVPMAPVLKQEPQRLDSRLLVAAAAGCGCLPTLDTSELLLLDHQQSAVVGPNSAAEISGRVPPPSVALPPFGVVDATATAALDFGTFPSFPTLDSWKVM